MRREKLFAVIFFLSLVAENDTVLAYYHEMWTPGRLFEWFTAVQSFKMSIFQVVCLLLLFGRKGAKTARPVTTAIKVSAASLVFSVVYGLAQGGLTKPLFTQTTSWAFCLVFTATAAKVLVSAEDFQRVENAIVLAAIWRSCMALLYFRMHGGFASGYYLTTHEDTVIFVVALLVLASRAVELRTRQFSVPLPQWVSHRMAAFAWILVCRMRRPPRFCTKARRPAAKSNSSDLWPRSVPPCASIWAFR